MADSAETTGNVAISHPEVGFIAVVTIRLHDDKAVDPLLDLLVDEVEEWVRKQPGFVSANYHVSIRRDVVLNYAQWKDEAAYKASFSASPRHGSLRDAILAVDGVDSLEMTPFTLARSVTGEGVPAGG